PEHRPYRRPAHRDATDGPRVRGGPGRCGGGSPVASAGMRIDLHTHSTVSDGTLPPAGVIAAAAAAGLDVVALTDHDSLAGWSEAAVAARSYGLEFVPGVEISCRWYGVEPSISLHLLGYWV